MVKNTDIAYGKRPVIKRRYINDESQYATIGTLRTEEYLEYE